MSNKYVLFKSKKTSKRTQTKISQVRQLNMEVKGSRNVAMDVIVLYDIHQVPVVLDVFDDPSTLGILFGIDALPGVPQGEGLLLPEQEVFLIHNGGAVDGAVREYTPGYCDIRLWTVKGPCNEYRFGSIGVDIILVVHCKVADGGVLLAVLDERRQFLRRQEALQISLLVHIASLSSPIEIGVA